MSISNRTSVEKQPPRCPVCQCIKVCRCPDCIDPNKRKIIESIKPPDVPSCAKIVAKPGHESKTPSKITSAAAFNYFSGAPSISAETSASIIGNFPGPPGVIQYKPCLCPVCKCQPCKDPHKVLPLTASATTKTPVATNTVSSGTKTLVTPEKMKLAVNVLDKIFGRPSTTTTSTANESVLIITSPSSYKPCPCEDPCTCQPCQDPRKILPTVIPTVTVTPEIPPEPEIPPTTMTAKAVINEVETFSTLEESEIIKVPLPSVTPYKQCTDRDECICSSCKDPNKALSSVTISETEMPDSVEQAISLTPTTSESEMLKITVPSESSYKPCTCEYVCNCPSCKDPRKVLSSETSSVTQIPKAEEAIPDKPEIPLTLDNSEVLNITVLSLTSYKPCTCENVCTCQRCPDPSKALPSVTSSTEKATITNNVSKGSEIPETTTSSEIPSTVSADNVIDDPGTLSTSQAAASIATVINEPKLHKKCTCVDVCVCKACQDPNRMVPTIAEMAALQNSQDTGVDESSQTS